MLADFHSHTTLSDGTLSMDDMVSAAERRGYQVYAITDHARGDDPDYLDVVTAVRDGVDRLNGETSVQLLAGVELTDFEPEHIPDVARRVRRAGAQVVVVHGECLVLTVPAGTNAAAARCADVNVLAHPGLLTDEDAHAALRHGVYVEISARHGADYGNGHVYRVARRHGTGVVVDSDAHDESGLLSRAKVEALLRGAGAPLDYVHRVQDEYIPLLVQQILGHPTRVSV